MNLLRIIFLQSLGPVIVYCVLWIVLVHPGTLFTYDTLTRLQLFLWIALVLVIFAALREVPVVTRWASRICEDQPESMRHKGSWVAFGTGLAITICAIWFEERQQPIFFTQDDNLAQFLPVMLQAGRASLHRIFSTWNPYQFLGAPTASLGVYALTYPVTYLSYYFSRFALGNEFLTLEVFCIFHLVSGYAATYWAAREYQVRPWIAAAAGVSAALSGWALIASRSWYYVCEIFLYVPLLIIAVRTLPRSSGWKWILLTGVTIGLFFHAGNAQFWTYGLIFFWIALATLWWAGQLTNREVLRAGAATLIGIGISAPLLIVQFLQTRGVDRVMNIYHGELTGEWLSYLVPGPWIHQYAPSNWVDPAWKTGGLIVYSGTIFIAFALLVLVALLSLHFSRRRLAANIWALCALLALACGVGDKAVLWPVMLRLPLFTAFRLPFKFIAFLDVFGILAGAIACERLLRKLRSPALAQAALTVLTFGMAGAICMFSLPSWYTYNVRPYPDASPITDRIPLAMQSQYRIMSLAMLRSRSPLFWEGMPLNFPTVYHVPTAFGYDPLIEQEPGFRTLRVAIMHEPVTRLPEYGVRYLVFANDFSKLHLGPYPGAWPLERIGTLPPHAMAQLYRDSTLFFRDQEITLGELKNAKPLAYLQADPQQSFPLTLREDGFDVDTSPLLQGGRVVLNFYWYKDMHAKADGKALSIGRDALARMTVELPAGTHLLQVRFQPPWLKASLLGLFVLALGVAAGIMTERQMPAGRSIQPS